MALNDDQKTAVTTWLNEGAKPAELQVRLEKEFGVRLTYMDVRLLIDDLKVMPKDPDPVEEVKDTPVEEAEAPLADALPAVPAESAEPAGSGKVSVSVDSIMKPGAMISGSVVFSDGKRSEWYLDQYGRLGMVPPEPGYRPVQSDVVAFQAALEREISKLGY
jgi:hypothetical protein